MGKRRNRIAVSIRTAALAAAMFLAVSPLPAWADGQAQGVSERATVVEYNRTAAEAKMHRELTSTLRCGASPEHDDCFDRKSSELLSRVVEGKAFSNDGGKVNYEHCLDADYLAPGPGSGVTSYPRTRAQANGKLSECVGYYQRMLKRAVGAAKDLVRENSGVLEINPRQADSVDDRMIKPYDGNPPGCLRFETDGWMNTAKCKVLRDVGLALHTAQDFWTHTNWGDAANFRHPLGVGNPQGMRKAEPPAFLGFPAPAEYAFPDELISGCDDRLGDCVGRVKARESLNKDDPGEAKERVSRTYRYVGPKRGPAVGRNLDPTNAFLAIDGGLDQTRSTWTAFVDRLEAVYGTDKSDLMVKALTEETPWTACRKVGGESPKADQPPVPVKPHAGHIVVTFQNKTSERLTCARVNAEVGEWVSYPTSPIPGGGTGKMEAQNPAGGPKKTVGGVLKYRIGKSKAMVTFRWGDLNRGYWSCFAPAPFKCTAHLGPGNNYRPRVEIGYR